MPNSLHVVSTMQSILIIHKFQYYSHFSIYPSCVAFAKVCHQSTDFHFPDINVQLRQVQEFASTALRERKEHKFTEASLSSQNSESHLSSTSPRSDESPCDVPERGRPLLCNNVIVHVNTS